MQAATCLAHTAARPALTPATTDAELAARAADGDDAAFEAIMRRHNRLLFRTARSILKSDAETEDALQDAYRAPGARWRAFAPIRNSRPGWCASSSTKRWAGCAAAARR
jgi:RNA polymerase sigma-70 factor, ECF subfamily